MKALLKQILRKTGLFAPVQKTRRLFEKKHLSPPAVSQEEPPAVLQLAHKNGAELSYCATYISVRKGLREIRINPAHEVYSSDMINFF